MKETKPGQARVLFCAQAGAGPREMHQLTIYSYQFIFLSPFPARGAFMRRHLCGERSGARGRGPLPRSRDGMGPRLRLLRAGARSSLTERLSPHEKRGPCREIAELERRRARLPRREATTEGPCARRRSGPLASLKRSGVCNGRMPGRVKKRGCGEDEGWLTQFLTLRCERAKRVSLEGSLGNARASSFETALCASSG